MRENHQTSKDGDDIRKSIPCTFKENCKFWKMDCCRYLHSSKYTGKVEIGDKRENELTSAEEHSERRVKKQCFNGKWCKNMNKCPYNHTCIRNVCSYGEKCKFIHKKTGLTGKENNNEDDRGKGNQKIRKDDANANKNTTSKKEILCKFYRNCKDGEDCKFRHPSSEKKNGNVTKNWQEEMYKDVHFLKNQMMEMMKEMKNIKMKQGKKQEGEQQEKML